MHLRVAVICNLLIFAGFVTCQTSQVYNLIYKDFDVNFYDKCIRLLNGTHEIGCQSTGEGNIGVLQHINNTDGMTKFLNKPMKRDYVLLIEASLFNSALVSLFKEHSRIQGVIVYENDNFVAPDWSPDLSCPDERFGLYTDKYGSSYKQCSNNSKLWNSVGDGLTEFTIPFPIFYIQSALARNDLIKCYHDHNEPENFPLCTVQMKARMFGAVSSVTCHRRTEVQTTLTPAAFCDPMGGKNVATSLKQLTNNPAQDESTILVTAALDSRSFMMFTQAPGVDIATGFISLLGIAKALGHLTKYQKQSLTKNIVFALFDGEAFDHIGSTRMLYDMNNGDFPVAKDTKKIQPTPLTFDKVSHVIELGPLGKIDTTVWVHYDPLSATSPSLNASIYDVINKLKTSSGSVSVQEQSPGLGLPPSSLQVFLKQRNISGMVLTDYDQPYTNKHYFSQFDTVKNLIGRTCPDHLNVTDIRSAFLPLAQKLSNVSTMTARTLHQLASGTTASSVSVDTDSMLELLHCFLCYSNCSLFQESLPVDSSVNLPGAAYNRYVSVYSEQNAGATAYIALHLLAYFTGEILLPPNSTFCAKTSINENDQTVTYYLLNGTLAGGIRNHTCVRSSSYFTPAVSVAFDNADVTSYVGNTGLWTESRWALNAFRLRMFLVQDEASQGMVLLAGLLVLLASFSFVYVVNSKSSVLFQSEGVI